MPWKNELPMEQKQRFINFAQSGRFTVSELCEEFGITRKTGHKWLLRYAVGGMKGLEERSRAPKKVSNRTSEEVERLIVSEKRQHMTWGAKEDPEGVDDKIKGVRHKLLIFKSIQNAYPHETTPRL